MVSGPDGNERAWTFREVGCRSGDEREPPGFGFETKITADAVETEPVDRPQARPVPVMPFRVRNKDIVQFGYTTKCAER